MALAVPPRMFTKKTEQLTFSSTRADLIRSVYNCPRVHSKYSVANSIFLILTLTIFLLKPNYASREKFLECFYGQR